jgi:hypothetical protein
MFLMVSEVSEDKINISEPFPAFTSVSLRFTAYLGIYYMCIGSSHMASIWAVQVVPNVSECF